MPTIPAGDVTSPGVVFQTPSGPVSLPAGVYTSPGVVFTPKPVLPPPPANTPTLTSLTPSASFEDVPFPFTVVLRGTNFTNTSLVSWAGNAITPTFVSSTELRVVRSSLGSFGTKDVFVYTKVPGAPNLRSNTLKFTVADGNPPPPPPPPPGEPGTYFGGFRLPETINAQLDALGAINIGTSYGKDNPGVTTPDGDVLPGFDIKRVSFRSNTGKPLFLLVAGIHAREIATQEMAMRFVEWLDADGSEAQALKNLVDIDVIPMVNPDGLWYVALGARKYDGPFLWRKNGRPSPGAAWPPLRRDHGGVDLNRNFPKGWGILGSDVEADTAPNGVFYRGESGASEPETINMMANIVETQPDLVLSLHSYGGTIGYPWAYTQTAAPDSAKLRATGLKIGAKNGYAANQASRSTRFPGQFEDWVYDTLRIPAYNMELGADTWAFTPPYSYMDALWAQTLPAIVEAAKQAGSVFP